MSEAPYPYFDQDDHGTHVAGTIAANGAGLVGVAPQAKILAARICKLAENCSSLAVLRSVNWGIKEQVDVINISFVATGFWAPLILGRACKAAAKAGIVVVASAGNDGTASVEYPARHSSTIAVGAVNWRFVKATFSQWGAQLDIMAPGVNVRSSVSGRSWSRGHSQSWSGTSMASPHVAGVAALVIATNPQLSPDQVKDILKSTAQPPQTPNDENQYGAGIVDAYRAVKKAAETDAAPPPATGTGGHWSQPDDRYGGGP